MTSTLAAACGLALLCTLLTVIEDEFRFLAWAAIGAYLFIVALAGLVTVSGINATEHDEGAR